MPTTQICACWKHATGRNLLVDRNRYSYSTVRRLRGWSQDPVEGARGMQETASRRPPLRERGTRSYTIPPQLFLVDTLQAR